ncbi:MAG: T9SS type A sorting domain-containing protein, partial [Bacteroidota bacterium]
AASDRAEDDEFGFAVAIDGNDIFIGANKEDEDENDENTADAAGSVYVFKLPSTFTQPETELQKLVADDRTSTDFFGFSVSIDGDYAIVGAYNEDEDVLGGNTLVNAGSAYIFERISDGSWQQQTKLVASDRNSGDFFGSSVSVRGDYAIVGAYNEDEDVSGGNTTNTAGSAYIFERAADGTWAETSKLVASDRAVSDLFGEAVAVDGDYAVIGARAEDQDADGGNVLDNAGSAYVFKRASDGTWSEVTKLVASDRAPFDNFGASVAIDGDYVIIGANFEDEDVNGENTADEAGAAYVFERSNDDTWTEVAKLVASDRANDDFFGFPVAISGDRAVVGAHQEDEDAMGENRLSRSGSAYVFERSSDDTWTEVAKLVASDRGVADFFGISVDISGDNVVVGAYQSEDGDTGENVGAAYIFKRSSDGNWAETMKLSASDRAEDDEFGFAVAIDGNDIFIGANREDEDQNNDNTASAAGSVYVFKLPSTVGTVTSVEEITNVDIHVFPNPTTDKVSIAVQNINPLTTTVNLVDFMGRIYKVRSGINQDKLDIELPEAKGVYVIQIVSNDGLIYSTRVIKI